MTRKTKPKQAGRSLGPQRPAPLSDVGLSRCPKCGSTDRAPYARKETKDLATTLVRAGGPYNRIVYRWTKCIACDQVRVDRTFELVTARQRRAR